MACAKSNGREPRRGTLPELINRLRRRSRKATGPRLAILCILHAHSHPVSPKDIFSALADRCCDLATVYRSLRLLEGLGMVKRFDFGDGVARFELVKEGDDGHHHHLICTRCAGVVEIEQCAMRQLDRRIGARNGFKSVTHRLEFFGLCPQCQ